MQGPIVIPGLDRHLELQDLAKRQAQDLQQRQAKAFKLNPQPGPFLATVPAPFRFKADDASVSTPPIPRPALTVCPCWGRRVVEMRSKPLHYRQGLLSSGACNILLRD